MEEHINSFPSHFSPISLDSDNDGVRLLYWEVDTNAFQVIHCGGAPVIFISHHLRQELKPQHLKCVLAPSSLATRQ